MLAREDLNDALAAGAVAAVLSGAPSTAYLLATRSDPLKGALAAGTLLLPNERRPVPLLLAGTVAHLGLSFGWALVLTAVLPRRHTVALATLAGLGIAALDTGLIGQRLPRIRELKVAPQVADHLAYGAAVGAVLSLRRSGRLAPAGR